MNKLILIISILITIGIVQALIYQEPIPKSNYIGLEQGIIAYDEYNSNITDKALIMIHGSVGLKDDFKLLGPEIKNHRAYALDMYGFGESEMQVKDYGISAQADVIKEFMDKKEIQKASILGYSWGGGVAIEFAHKYPERTENMILLASMGIQEGEATKTYLGEHLRYSLSYPFAVYYPTALIVIPFSLIQIGMHEQVPIISEAERHGFMRSFMDTDQRPIRQHLQEINTETLILHGDKDTIIEPWVAEEHAKLLKNSKLVFYNGTHLNIFQNVTDISPAINQFINRQAQAKISIIIER